jgi:hypothetical protein
MGEAERSHRIDKEGVVIDDAEVFNSKLWEWQDYHRPAVLVQKVHTNVSHVSVTHGDLGRHFPDHEVAPAAVGYVGARGPNRRHRGTHRRPCGEGVGIWTTAIRRKAWGDMD